MKRDIAPSQFERFAGDGYFTIDAPWIVPALIRTIPIEGPIYEPAAGRGHLVVELRRLGFEVKNHRSSCASRPARLRYRRRRRHFRAEVAQALPFRRHQSALCKSGPDAKTSPADRTARPLSRRDPGARRMDLRQRAPRARSRQSVVCRRSATHPASGSIRPVIASPRHSYSWYLWAPVPRARGQDPFLRFAGDEKRVRARGGRRGCSQAPRPGRFAYETGRVSNDPWNAVWRGHATLPVTSHWQHDHWQSSWLEPMKSQIELAHLDMAAMQQTRLQKRCVGAIGNATCWPPR